MGSSPIPATRPVGQAVKTPPFHGGNSSSILLRVTNGKKTEYHNMVLRLFSLIAALHKSELRQNPKDFVRTCVPPSKSIPPHKTARFSSDSATGVPFRFCCRAMILIQLFRCIHQARKVIQRYVVIPRQHEKVMHRQLSFPAFVKLILLSGNSQHLRNRFLLFVVILSQISQSLIRMHHVAPFRVKHTIEFW